MTIEIHVTGRAGEGKTTIATMIQKYLQTVGFVGVTVELTDKEMPPCPTDLNKRASQMMHNGTRIKITEQPTRGEVSSDETS